MSSDLAAGQLRIVAIVGGSQFKPRPAVLVRPHETGWWVAGLTTVSHYNDGSPRVPVPNPAAVGLRGRGFLWSGSLQRIAYADIDRDRLLGQADDALMQAIMENMQAV